MGKRQEQQLALEPLIIAEAEMLNELNGQNVYFEIEDEVARGKVGRIGCTFIEMMGVVYYEGNLAYNINHASKPKIKRGSISELVNKSRIQTIVRVVDTKEFDAKFYR